MSGGVPGSAVAVSVFEEAPSQRQRQRHEPKQQQQRRRRQQEEQQQQRQQRQEADPFSRLRTECLKELLRHSGITDGGRELAGRFSVANLSAAFAELIAAFADFCLER